MDHEDEEEDGDNNNNNNNNNNDHASDDVSQQKQTVTREHPRKRGWRSRRIRREQSPTN